MDKEMVEVIRQWQHDDAYVVYQTVEDLAQRLHDAGYRKVPSTHKIFDEIAGKCISNDSALLASQAISDLMMGGK